MRKGAVAETEEVASEVVPEEEFGEAFDEAVAEDEGQEGPTVDDVTDLEDRAEGDEPISEGTGEEEFGGEKGTTGVEQPTGDEAGGEETAGDEEGAAAESGKEETPKGESIEELKHKLSTLQGMYNSEVKAKSKLEEQLAGSGTDEETSSRYEKPEDNFDNEISAITDKIKGLDSVKAMQEEYGDEMTQAISDVAKEITKTLMGSMSQRLDNQLGQVVDVLAPLQDNYVKTASDTHFSTIKEAHPDYEKYRDSGELIEWIESQSGIKKNLFLDIYEDGDEKEVVELYDVFKKAKGYSDSQEEESGDLEEEPAPSVDQGKLEDMETVDTKRAPVGGGKGKIAKSDFDGAWENA